MKIYYQIGVNHDASFWLDDREYWEEILGIKTFGIVNLYLKDEIDIFNLIRNKRDDIIRLIFQGKPITEKIEFVNAEKVN